MRSRALALSSLFTVVSLAALIALVVGSVSGCDWFRRTPTPARTPTPTAPPAATPTATPIPSSEIPPRVLTARDTALTFFRDTYPGKAPAESLVWTGRETTPPGVVGVSTYEFISDSWLMNIAALSITPTEIWYELALDNPPTGLHWTGRLDSAYNLLESNLNIAVEVLIVRELVLAYVREYHPEQGPAENLVWIGERTTPPGIIGRETCQFISGDWAMTVEYAVVSPEKVVYAVELRNASTGYAWRGQVDAEGTVLEHR